MLIFLLDKFLLEKFVFKTHQNISNTTKVWIEKNLNVKIQVRRKQALPIGYAIVQQPWRELAVKIRELMIDIEVLHPQVDESLKLGIILSVTIFL